ncbi:hypothetical protein LEMLEM_LOCUS19525 [Lemmus lemmus]
MIRKNKYRPDLRMVSEKIFRAGEWLVLCTTTPTPPGLDVGLAG